MLELISVVRSKVEILMLGMPPGGAVQGGGGGEPAEPSAPNSGAAKVQKLPIPEHFIPIQKSFEDALQRCLTAPNLSPVGISLNLLTLIWCILGKCKSVISGKKIHNSVFSL